MPRDTRYQTLVENGVENGLSAAGARAELHSLKEAAQQAGASPEQVQPAVFASSLLGLARLADPV